jgi:hypothetical protein
MAEDSVSFDESTRLLDDAPSGNRSPDDESPNSSGGQHSIYESSPSEIDDDELQYDLARVNSHPNGLGMEPNPQETMPLARPKTYGTVGSQGPTTREPGLEEDPSGKPAVNEADLAEIGSKFWVSVEEDFGLSLAVSLRVLRTCITISFWNNADVLQGSML